MNRAVAGGMAGNGAQRKPRDTCRASGHAPNRTLKFSRWVPLLLRTDDRTFRQDQQYTELFEFDPDTNSTR